jgi:hypothetical protein
MPRPRPTCRDTSATSAARSTIRRRLCNALLLACAFAQPAGAGEVIAHPSVNLSASEIRDVYLGEIQFSGRVKLVPVDNASVQADFLSKVLQSDERKYAARWTRKTFREGLAAPAVKRNDAEVIDFVRATPGAVGYIKGSAPGMAALETF